MISKSIVVAYNKKLAIGKSGNLLWQDKEDLKRFKALTIGHPIIMGRKTHESIGKILPNRTNIIVSRDRDYMPLGLPALVTQSLHTAISIAEGLCKQDKVEEMFIIGGGQIYEQALPMCDTLYVSEFDNDLEGDAYFPKVCASEWEEKIIDHEETHIFKMLERRK